MVRGQKGMGGGFVLWERVLKDGRVKLGGDGHWDGE